MSITRIILAAVLVEFIAAEFCSAQLWTDQDACPGNVPVESNGCCTGTNRCPKTCLQAGWSSTARGSETTYTCTCKDCLKVRTRLSLDLSTEDRWVKAHNYFRCLHEYPDLSWNDAMTAAVTEVAAAQVSDTLGNSPKPPCSMKHSDSYKNIPSSGENLAQGQTSIESAIEDWLIQF